MNHVSQHQLNTLLHEYLDDVLGDTERRFVDDLIARDESVRKELDRLKRMKELLAGQERIQPDPAFWTRLSATLAEHKEEDNLLPFPRKYFPSAALASVVGVLLIGTVIFQNRMSLFHFLNQKSQIVQSVYEEGILKGSIIPLLSHIDNNQVLQFSLLGVLPLDRNSEATLKVDQNSSNGYQINLSKTSPKKSKPITVKDFYAEIQATKPQQDVMDSLFGLARRKIESSVLVSDNHAVAIDPALAQLNRVMVSNIAACLEPFQRVRFGRYLEKKDAPYTFVSKKFVPANPESIYVEMSRVPTSRRFVVVTADTLTYANVNAEVIRRVQQNAEISQHMVGLAQRNLELTERLLRRYAGREPIPVNEMRMPAPPFEVWKDANTVGIQFQREANEPRWEIRQPVVVPLLRHMQTYSMSSPAGRLEFGFYGDSVTAGEVMIDSAMARFFNRDNSADYNLRMMDSIFTAFNSRFEMHPGAFPLDSVFRTLEEARRKAFEEGRQRRASVERDVRLRKKEPPSHER
jgi:hypothetical protein